MQIGKSVVGGGCIAAVVAALAVVSAPASAEEGDVSSYRAQAIRVIDDSATMYKHDEGILFSSTGPVGKQGIPGVIRQGDVVRVKNETIRANLIIVKVYHKDMKWQGEYLARKGDVKCMIVENEENIPSDSPRDKLWINVAQCAPIR